MTSRRSYLFLQGVCSPFFARLADRLKADGHRIFRINFNGGDVAYWGKRPAWQYRGSVQDFRGYVAEKYHRAEITDLVVFGDRRPVHRPAIELAQDRGIRVHVFEEGYFRPHWITVEREGVNGHSLLPKEPDWYREVGKRLPDHDNGVTFHSPFRTRALHDVLYHLAGAANPLFFSGYRTHAPIPAPLEYAGYVRRFALKPRAERKDRHRVRNLIHSGRPFYLLPLQLNSDAQIRDHSPFDDMTGVMEHVMASFAGHAPGDTRLVIKNHPLDVGLVNYPRIINRLAHRFDLAGRVDYLETGNLLSLLNHASGVVTVNSTAGGEALHRDRPTMALSDPIYHLPGLTFQGELNDFWQRGEAPDRELFRRFRNTVIHTTLANGGYYCRNGIALSVENASVRLTADRSPLEELL